MDNPTNSPKGVLQVLFLAAEADPLIKVGGLGDVAGSLPPELRALDPTLTGGYLLDVRLVIPFHGAISMCPEECKPVLSFQVNRPGGAVEARAFQVDRGGMPIYLIAGDPIPPEAPVYSLDTEKDGEKYVFFSLAALELAKALDWKPDVIHANDWHTAAAIYALTTRKQTDPFFANTHSVLTVHNLPFMGAGTSRALETYGLPPSNNPDLPDWGRHFPLLMGLAAADRIVAVSPTYAKEILNPEFGLGVEHFLKTCKEKISGILNGLDMNSWNPANDEALAAPFDVESLSRREENKKALLAEFNLDYDPQVPLLIMISRMDQQKGVDLVVEGLRMIPDLPWQAVLLGSGDPNLENICRWLEADFPNRVRAAVRFDPNLSRRMYAGADALMMPSRYEPCGLAQMIAMRYGCVPVARAVGGLRDTIIDLPDQPESSTGFLFEPATAEALAGTLRRALKEYTHHELWQMRQRLGMKQDFSWQRSALSYANIYLNL